MAENLFPLKYIASLGTNIRENAYLRLWNAFKFLENSCAEEIIDFSPVYSISSSPYFNQIVVFFSHLSLRDIIQKIKVYEFDCGRTQSQKDQGIVIIDIDIVVEDSKILRPDYNEPYFQHGLTLLKYKLSGIEDSYK